MEPPSQYIPATAPCSAQAETGRHSTCAQNRPEATKSPSCPRVILEQDHDSSIRALESIGDSENWISLTQLKKERFSSPIEWYFGENGV